MPEYQLEIKQSVDSPRCRICRQCICSLMEDRRIRVSGGSGLLYFVVLSSYANSRISYRGWTGCAILSPRRMGLPLFLQEESPAFSGQRISGRRPSCRYHRAGGRCRVSKHRDDPRGLSVPALSTAQWERRSGTPFRKLAVKCQRACPRREHFRGGA